MIIKLFKNTNKRGEDNSKECCSKRVSKRERKEREREESLE